MNDLKWQHTIPTVTGWYWVSYPDGHKSMWFFDGSHWDVEELKEKADGFYGPLQPPEETNDDK
jgi:hypothetical protein